MKVNNHFRKKSVFNDIKEEKLNDEKPFIHSKVPMLKQNMQFYKPQKPIAHYKAQ